MTTITVQPRSASHNVPVRHPERLYYVYILASKSRVLYIGVTHHLAMRIAQHKDGSYGALTAKYKVYRLVHFDRYHSPSAAIAREKQLKGWLRVKKIALIERDNPTWEDLAAEWETAGPSTRGPILSARSGFPNV
ncbi:MAG TPA: GIY-YIG nuclease family protein [Candidatus Angelobacter sp.]|nr:GIY-YIG nuclease family protein [Candidatus Angelobacter sp.]